MYEKNYSTNRTLTASGNPADITGSVHGLSWHVCTSRTEVNMTIIGHDLDKAHFIRSFTTSL